MISDKFNVLNKKVTKETLGTNVLGRMIYYFDEIESTNTLALALTRDGSPEGTIVLADSQTGGQGRLQRRWISPRGGGLWFTLILRPQMQPDVVYQITLLAAVATVIGIQTATGISAGIKWPNDLLIKGKKVCGIFAEMEAADTVNYVILGIGINVNMDHQQFSPEIQSTATSLALELGCTVDSEAILSEVLRQLEYWYKLWQLQGVRPVLAAWKQRNITLGQCINVKCRDQTWSGKALDINEEGALVVHTTGGEILSFDFGEVSIR